MKTESSPLPKGKWNIKRCFYHKEVDNRTIKTIKNWQSTKPRWITWHCSKGNGRGMGKPTGRDAWKIRRPHAQTQVFSGVWKPESWRHYDAKMCLDYTFPTGSSLCLSKTFSIPSLCTSNTVSYWPDFVPNRMWASLEQNFILFFMSGMDLAQSRNSTNLWNLWINKRSGRGELWP